MKKFKLVECEGEKKYRLIDVAAAIGVTRNAVANFMRKRYGTSSSGMTLQQIIEYINTPHKNREMEKPDLQEAASILKALRERGIVEDVDEQITMGVRG